VKRKATIAVLATGAAVFLVLAFAWEYRPPLVSDRRNPKEIALDFLGFGWHYSRYFWLANVRDWPKANRQRLLAFWHRPDWSGFSDLRERSLFELGCWYERFALPDPAARLLIEACRREPGNRWLLRQSAAKLCQIKQGENLEELLCLIRESHPEDREISAWLEDNFPAPGADGNHGNENSQN